jgi:hypothetical protein
MVITIDYVEHMGLEIITQVMIKLPPLSLLVQAGLPRSSGAGCVASNPANSNVQNVPSFRRWRLEMKPSPLGT